MYAIEFQTKVKNVSMGEGLEDREGRTHGPFDTADEMIASVRNMEARATANLTVRIPGAQE
jgi:hypothetical protein